MQRLLLNPERVRWYLNLWVVRGLLRWVTAPLGERGEVRLEWVLAYYGRKREGLSLFERMSFFPIFVLIELLRLVFRWRREYLVKEVFSSRNMRRVVVNLAKSVAEFGVTKPQVFSAPLLVVWNFTNLCNLKCRHCYQDAGKLSPQLTLRERLAVIEELEWNFVPVLAFAGGEPLVDPDFFPVAQKAASREIYLSVATNGVLLSRDMCKRLKESGVSYVEVSLDSSFPEYHDRFRGIPDLWKKTVQGIENAIEVGLLVGIAPTITRENLHDLADLYRLACALGAHRFYAFNFIPTGRGKDIGESDLSPEEREVMLEVLYQCLLEKRITVFSTSPQFGRKCMEKNPQSVVITGHYSLAEGTLAGVAAQYIGGCGAGRAYCALQPDGTVTPCVFLPIPVGHILRDGLGSIWHNSVVMQELRKREKYKPHCGICAYREVCGGCRARAYAYSGDYLAADPGCRWNRDVWEGYRKGAHSPSPKEIAV